MAYQIDLANITLSQYQNKLKTRYLIPSQQILKENLEKRFDFFRGKGITNLKELLKLLKDKKEYSSLLESGHFSEEYLKVLLRNIKGMLTKARKLSDFSWISRGTLIKLEKAGIKAQLYKKVLSFKNIDDFTAFYYLDSEEARLLIRQCDLTRIQWVNHSFARALYEAGYDSPAKIAKVDYKKLYQDIIQTNEKKQLYKGKIGLNDTKLLVEVSQDIKTEINENQSPLSEA